MYGVDTSQYGVPQVHTRDVPDWTRHDNSLFRGDTRSPAEIRADGGFRPPYFAGPEGSQRDPARLEANIAQHVGGRTNAFVSTSTDVDVAQDFAGSIGNVYVVNAPGGIYTDPTLRPVTGKETHGEGEVLFPGGIDWRYVRGWHEMRYEPGTGRVMGEFQPNPDYIGDRASTTPTSTTTDQPAPTRADTQQPYGQGPYHRGQEPSQGTQPDQSGAQPSQQSQPSRPQDQRGQTSQPGRQPDQRGQEGQPGQQTDQRSQEGRPGQQSDQRGQEGQADQHGQEGQPGQRSQESQRPDHENQPSQQSDQHGQESRPDQQPDHEGRPGQQPDQYGPATPDASRPAEPSQQDTSPITERLSGEQPASLGDRMGPLNDPRLDALRPHLHSTEGGMSAFAPPNSNDPGQQAAHQNEQATANQVPRIPGQFVVDMHGSPNSVRVGDTRLSPRDLADIIRANPDYDGGPVSLLGCNTGSDPNGFASQLAQELGVPVTAPSRDAWVDHDGNVYASSHAQNTDPSQPSRPTWPPNGEWNTYSPTGEPTSNRSPYPPGHTPTWARDSQSRPTGMSANRGDDPPTRPDDTDRPAEQSSADRRHPTESTDRRDPTTETDDSTRADRREPETETDDDPRADPRDQETDDNTPADPNDADTDTDNDPPADPHDQETDDSTRDEQELTTEPAPTAEARRDRDDEQDANAAAETFLLMSTEYSPRRGGVVVFNRSLAEALADAGHNVYVRIGEDATPYADAQRDNLRILGPESLPETPPGGRAPNPRDFLGTEHDPSDMPENVDYVVGHTRFSGPDAQATRDARYPDAKLIHFVHMVPEALGRVKAQDPGGEGEVAEGIRNHEIERDLVARADLAVGVGPAITENAREMVEQARANDEQQVATQNVHELIPGMEFRDRRERSIEGREMNVFIFGRADVGQKGATEAAEVVRALRDQGYEVRLTVRGVPPDLVDQQRAALSEIVDADVEVRPFTEERSDLHTDLDDADVMVMTSRAEGFGLTAQEAAAAGVPVVVPSSSGFGRWLGESEFSSERTGPSIVEQGFEDRVPVDKWIDALKNVADDYPGAQQRALELQQEFKDNKVTWEEAVKALTEEAGRLR